MIGRVDHTLGHARFCDSGVPMHPFPPASVGKLCPISRSLTLIP